MVATLGKIVDIVKGAGQQAKIRNGMTLRHLFQQHLQGVQNNTQRPVLGLESDYRCFPRMNQPQPLCLMDHFRRHYRAPAGHAV